MEIMNFNSILDFFRMKKHGSFDGAAAFRLMAIVLAWQFFKCHLMPLNIQSKHELISWSAPKCTSCLFKGVKFILNMLEAVAWIHWRVTTISSIVNEAVRKLRWGQLYCRKIGSILSQTSATQSSIRFSVSGAKAVAPGSFLCSSLLRPNSIFASNLQTWTKIR